MMLKEPIDIVYTWVNNNDSEWLQKKQKFSLIQKGNKSDDNCRYYNNDELKYSLRSLEKYAFWIDNIYIVTDNQVPQWLNLSHPKIKIIDHKDIMPKEYLPTFNSFAIEFCIHNIANLSEKFLYANDDMFFNNYVSPSYFFANDGYPYFYFKSKYEQSVNEIFVKTLINADKLIKDKYGNSLEMHSHHNIDAYRKSDLKLCNDIFKDSIYNTIANKFRTENDINRIIYAYFALAIKHGHYKGVFRIDKILPFYKNKMLNFLLKHHKQTSIYYPATNRDYSELNKKYIKLFCINDNENTTAEDRNFVVNFLNNLYREKSSFEL